MFRLVFALTLIVSTIARPSVTLDGRIVGGDAIDIKQTPYQVSVQLNGEHWCGGSLIAPDWVLTASHCFQEEDIYTLDVRVGSTASNKGGQLIKVAERFEHDGFNMDVVSNDITLLKLAEKVKLSAYAAIIPLATAEPAPRSNAYISGWGKTSEHNSTLPINLRGVQVSLITREDCRKRYKGEEIFDYNVCAFSKGKDSCQSDSGGPMVINNKLAGIVSWGDGCAKGNNPGVYTSVPKFLEWIKKTMK